MFGEIVVNVTDSGYDEVVCISSQSMTSLE